MLAGLKQDVASSQVAMMLSAICEKPVVLRCNGLERALRPASLWLRQAGFVLDVYGVAFPSD